uniref:Uncharacterized protein n=1 Tax=viral metagenome TaxID=1070528 RepID=A0A6C0M144_9ZZZZ
MSIQYFNAFIVYILLFAIVYRFNISIRYFFPFVLGCIFVYYQHSVINIKETNPFNIFINDIQYYEKYNPQQYNLLKEEILRYEEIGDSTDLLNVFHDFIHTLPLSLVDSHKRNMTYLEKLAPRTNDIHSDFNTYRFYA